VYFDRQWAETFDLTVFHSGMPPVPTVAIRPWLINAPF